MVSCRQSCLVQGTCTRWLMMVKHWQTSSKLKIAVGHQLKTCLIWKILHVIIIMKYCYYCCILIRDKACWGWTNSSRRSLRSVVMVDADPIPQQCKVLFLREGFCTLRGEHVRLTKGVPRLYVDIWPPTKKQCEHLALGS